MTDEKTKAFIEECKQDLHAHIDRRFNAHRLTDEQIDEIAEKAATKALSKITDLAYREVGKSVMSKLFYVTGVIAVAAFLYLQSHGWIK